MVNLNLIICIDNRFIMKTTIDPPPPLQLRNAQRNQKIASILTLLITISAKIEKLKQKICGFSASQFSPQTVFEALDLTNKGYLDLYDIRSFLGNDVIKDKDILLFFMNFGGTKTQPKLSYLGYLNFLKPYFNPELARDLLRRDTLAKRGAVERAIETQETILLLLHQLFLLNCVRVAEHQELKEALLQEYVLNCLQISEILGMDVEKTSPMRAIHEFINSNSDYDVEEGEIKFLLSYLQVHQFDLKQERVMTTLFMPTNLGQQPVTSQRKTGISARERQQLHTNYNKSYLGKQDLITNQTSFLNYIHPNSLQPQQTTQINNIKQKRKTVQYEQNESIVAQEHPGLGLSHNKSNKHSLKQMRHLTVPGQDEKLDYSIVEPSNVFGSRGTARLNPVSQVNLHTPILEQFMHEKNIKHNMGHYSPNQPNQLNSLLQEQSNMQNSEAFVQLEINPPIVKVSPLKQSKQIVQNQNLHAIGNALNNRFGDSSFAQKGKDFDRSGGQSILKQFIRSDLT